MRSLKEFRKYTVEQEGRAALSEMGEFVSDFEDAISQTEIDEHDALNFLYHKLQLI